MKKLFLLICATLWITGCSWWSANKEEIQSSVKTVDTIAQSLCGIFYGEKMGLNISDAIKGFCDTREKYEPWIDQVLAGAKSGGDRKLGISPINVTFPVPEYRLVKTPNTEGPKESVTVEQLSKEPETLATEPSK